MDVKSLKGIAVVSIEQGEKVGTVDNMLFDLERKRVLAFKLTRPGLLRSGGIVTTMDDVESIGKDAIMIRNKEKIREFKNERELQSRPDLGALTALRVVTQDGTYVGNLSTVQIEPMTGMITDFEVSGGGLMDRLRRNQVIPASDVLSIGSDVVVVPDSYATATDSESTEDSVQSQDEKPGEEDNRIIS